MLGDYAMHTTTTAELIQLLQRTRSDIGVITTTPTSVCIIYRVDITIPILADS